MENDQRIARSPNPLEFHSKVTFSSYFGGTDAFDLFVVFRNVSLEIGAPSLRGFLAKPSGLDGIMAHVWAIHCKN